MKKCPNCNADVEENFELCWSCNYSFTEKRVLDIKDIQAKGSRDVSCLRCDVEMIYSGIYKFHEGKRLGAAGNLLELFVNREEFELYTCPKCGKVEFFTPLYPEEVKP